MHSINLVDSELVPLVEQFPTFAFEAGGLAQARAISAAMMPSPTPSAYLQVDVAYAPGRDGAPDVRLVVTQPRMRRQRRPGILHLHGGGFVMGTADMNAEMDMRYARELGAVVVSVDYRLAPETPHPGPLEDCYAGLLWLRNEANRLDVDLARIVVTGASAGGGLAAALALLARERGEVSIAHQHLIFPMLDDRTAAPPELATRELATPVGEFVWTRENNQFAWTALLGQVPGGSGVSSFAAPARATDLSGLPPAFIVCGSLDLFLDEDLEYGRRLAHAGVATEMHVYPGAPHAFALVAHAQVTQQFFRDSMTALARVLKCA